MTKPLRLQSTQSTIESMPLTQSHEPSKNTTDLIPLIQSEEKPVQNMLPPSNIFETSELIEQDLQDIAKDLTNNDFGETTKKIMIFDPQNINNINMDENRKTSKSKKWLKKEIIEQSEISKKNKLIENDENYSRSIILDENVNNNIINDSNKSVMESTKSIEPAKKSVSKTITKKPVLKIKKSTTSSDTTSNSVKSDKIEYKTHTCIICQEKYDEIVKYMKNGVQRSPPEFKLCPTHRRDASKKRCQKSGKQGCNKLALTCLGSKYCAKDIKHYYLEKYEEEGKKPCSRMTSEKGCRCLNFIPKEEDNNDPHQRCKICKSNDNSNERYHHKNEISKNAEIIDKNGIEYKQCGHCKKLRKCDDFIVWNGDKSDKCNVCRAKNAVIDNRRKVKLRKNGATSLQKYSYLITNAKKRNKTMKLTFEEADNLFKQNCHYCDRPVINNRLSGIDRVINSDGYVVDNCVSCCYICNTMKGILNQRHFILSAIHIATFLNLYAGELYPEFFRFSRRAKPYLYRGDAAKKKQNRIHTENDYSFHLTDEEFYKIVKQNCTYCGTKPNSSINEGGIDRSDNKIGYTVENAVSCCTICNFIKQNITLDIFREKIKLIATKWYPIFKRQKDLENILQSDMVKLLNFAEETTDLQNAEFDNELALLEDNLWDEFYEEDGSIDETNISDQTNHNNNDDNDNDDDNDDNDDNNDNDNDDNDDDDDDDDDNDDGGQENDSLLDITENIVPQKTTIKLTSKIINKNDIDIPKYKEIKIDKRKIADVDTSDMSLEQRNALYVKRSKQKTIEIIGYDAFRSNQNTFYTPKTVTDFFDMDKIRNHKWDNEKDRNAQVKLVKILDSWEGRKKPTYAELSKLMGIGENPVRRLCHKK
jgi:hypothetical protein